MKQLLICFLTVFVILSCDSRSTGEIPAIEGEQADSGVLRLAVIPTLDCLPLFLASEHNMFGRAGLEVAIVTYSAQMDCDTALQNGFVKAMATDLVRAEHLRQQNIPITFLSATDADWLLLTSRSARIKKLSQLDDKMMGMTRYSATDMLGDLAVDSGKLKEERVFRIQVNDVVIRQNMLIGAMIDAALLPQPQATAAINQQSCLILRPQARFDLQLGVIAMRENSLSKEQVEAFCKAYNEACDSLNARGLQSYSELIKKLTGADQQTVDSLPVMEFRHTRQPRERDVERAREWLKKKLEKADVEKQRI